MKTIILVTYQEMPMRAFKNKKDAKAWIIKFCKNYKLNILNFLIQEIIMYE